MATTAHQNVAPSSLNVSTSQTTVSAPVLEFRCMFTHDLHKKQKKWHDGKLRFHTFNRRAMVYDENTNLVGDLHYRQNEDLREGVELQLDRPVLVQVEEQISQTSTDLTPLLGRQKPDGSSNPNIRTSRMRTTRPPYHAVNAQVQAKSIKELLGGPRGRLGRARLPLQSPFELRQVLAEVQLNPQPAAKRRKVDGEKEPRQTINTHRSTSVAAPGRNASSTISTCKEQVINISSEDEATLGPRGDTKSSKRVSPRRAPSNSVSTPKRTKASKTRELEQPREADSLAPERSRIGLAAHREHARSSSIQDIASLSQVQSQRRLVAGPRSSLRFGASRQRLKLMCRAPRAQARTERLTDLLEDDDAFAASQIAREVANAETAAERQENMDSHQTPSPAETRLVNLSVPSIHMSSPTGSHDEVDVGMDQTSRVPNSPLFVSQHESESELSPKPRLMVRDKHEELPLEPICQSALAKLACDDQAGMRTTKSPCASPRQSSTPIHLPRSPLLSKRSTVRSQEAPEPPNRLQPDVDNWSTSPDTSATPIKQIRGSSTLLCRGSSRPLRRVASENITSRPSLGDLLDDDDDELIELFDQPRQPSNRHTPQQRATTQPSRLSDVVSDPIPPQSQNRGNSSPRTAAEDSEGVTAKLVSEKKAPVAAISNQAESGPWTAEEAYLLFDWWPPDRQKPYYGDARSTPRSGQEGVERSRMNANVMAKKYGTFGSARLVSQR